MLQKLLTNALLLRRLVKAQESQAASLALIAKVLIKQYGHPEEPVAEIYPNAGDEDLSYSSDGASYAAQERDKQRLIKPASEEY